MEESIYVKSVHRVEGGATFKIDFLKREMRLNKRAVIKEGGYEGCLNIDIATTTSEFITTLESLYGQYLHSIPSERSEAKQKRYFIAMPLDALTDEDMMFGERRDIAQFRLEFFVLETILAGRVKWSDFADGLWFWKSEKYPSLVLLRQWFEPIKVKLNA